MEEKINKTDKIVDKIHKNMAKIKHKIVVISGKGGVGKTTVAVNLAAALANEGQKVGILDVDITGPNVAKMLGISPELKPWADPKSKKIFPVDGPLNLKVLSMALLTKNPDLPVIWRGPMKMNALRQFLGEVVWGELDYLVCDLPPGTSDEVLDILQLIPDETVVVVSTPQDVAIMDARKTIKMTQIMKRNLLGIVENMSVFKCPKCGELIEIFGSGGGEKAAKDFGIRMLGKIPFEKEIGKQGDLGLPFIFRYPNSESSKAFKSIVKKIRDINEKN
ncbi:MAG: ATP-binding protein [Promethearchaeota archaeon]|nr:MAG: ATP-binding protein [Candidatus Lokiarchaeota archaeon]